MCGFSGDETNCIPLDGCGNPLAYLYYISFTLIVTFVFFNLFIAVILEASEISTEPEEEQLSEEHLHQFMKQWIKYDPNDNRSITVTKLRALLQDLDRPMGYGTEYVASEDEITSLIKQLHIPVYVNNQREPIVLFMDTAHALAGMVHDRMAKKKGKSLADFNAPSAGSAMSRRQSKALSKNLMLAGLDESAAVLYTTTEIHAAITMQRQFRAHKFRKNIDKRVDGSRKVG